MKVLPYLAALAVVALLAGAVLAAVQGAWLVVGLLLGAVVGVGLVANVVVSKRRRPPVSGYVERERIGY